MSTVKISDLPALSTINANTANTVIVGLDIPTNITGKMTLTTLAAGLYSNNFLVVGNNFTVLPNVAGQFTGNSAAYMQINLENQTGNGSGDIVITADTGTDSDYYIDMGLNGSTYDYPGFTFAKALDGYLIVQGSSTSPTLNGGNLVIGTTTTGKDITFTQGSIDESGRVAQFIYDTGFKLLKKPLIFADGTTQNTAVLYSAVDSRVSANVSTLRGEITANAATANSIINTRISANVATLRGEITGNISTQNTFTQAAFNKANSALANASGTFNGNLEILGNVSMYSIATSNIASFVSSVTPSGNALLEIVGSLGGVQQAPSQDGYMIHVTNKIGLPARVILDTFGSSNNYSVIAGRNGRGTAAAPSATQNNDVIMRISGNGFGTTEFSPLGTSKIDFVASENYTDTARGTRIEFWNAPIGSNTIQKIASFNGDSAEFLGSIEPRKGFIYTPRIFNGAQTAITLNFANDSIMKANTSAGVTVSLSNFLAGKVVEIWITNTSGGSQTFTHGCSALASTVNATTYNIPSTSSILAKYMCFNNDAANVFVSIIHA